MAGKSKEMSTIKQVLIMHRNKVSNRQIARELNLYKGTVNKYVKQAEADRLSIGELVKLDDPELERRFGIGNPAYTDKRFDDFQQRLSYIVEELGRKHVTMFQLWKEYRCDNPDGYGYTQFCYHVNQYVSASDDKVSFVLSPYREGGQELFVDFAGDTMSYVDEDTGEEVKCQIFVACLPASDYGFALAVRSQKVEDFLYAMARCLKAIGGVPKIIVTDNLKAAVVRADRYMPELNQMMEDFANHYGCVHIPTRSWHPKDKALVEDQVKLVYRRVFAPLRNRVFFSTEELNVAITEQMRLHNQTRMQRLPYTREERFLALDKPALGPLPERSFEIRCRTQLAVLPNSHIYMGRDKVYYSVPYDLIGQKVQVIYTRTLVSIYSLRGEKVATHIRCREAGKYVTDEAHMPSYYGDYVNLSPQKYIERYRRASAALGEVVSEIFRQNGNLPPETFYKSCDGLLHLQKVTDKHLFDRACRVALEYRRCKYGFIKSLIDSKCSGVAQDDEPVLFPETHDNIRGSAYYK